MPRRPVRPGHRRGDPKWAVNTRARESKRARVPPSVTPVAKTRCTGVVSRNTKSPGAAPVCCSMQPLNTRFPSSPGTAMGMQWYDADTDAVNDIMLSSAPITTCRGVFQSAEGCCADPQRAASNARQLSCTAAAWVAPERQPSERNASPTRNSLCFMIMALSQQRYRRRPLPTSHADGRTRTERAPAVRIRRWPAATRSL